MTRIMIITAMVILSLTGSRSEMAFAQAQNQRSTVQVWEGQHVRITAPVNENRQTPITKERILDALDVASEYYTEVTGNSRGIIEIRVQRFQKPPGTYGGALTVPGSTEIVLSDDAWQNLYKTVQMSNSAELRFEQTLFYELCRCFWDENYNRMAGRHFNFGTALAIVMRMKSMDAAEVHELPRAGLSHDQIRAGYTRLLEECIASEQTWQQLLPQDFSVLEIDGVENRLRLGSADLLAAAILRLAQKYGGESQEEQTTYLKSFLDYAARINPPRNRAAAFDNFAVCASMAAQQDLTQDGEELANWEWPVTRVGRNLLERLEGAGWQLAADR